MSDIQEMEKFIEAQQQFVDLRDGMERLSNNPDFKKLIIDGFCLHQAARYITESVDMTLDKSDRDDALGYAQAAGRLRHWIAVTKRMGNDAEKQIMQAREALDEMRQIVAEEDQ